MDELIGQIGALLVGNRTFGGDDPYKSLQDRAGKPFGGGWNGPQFVLTHHTARPPVPDVTFVSDTASGCTTTRAGPMSSSNASA